MSSKPTVRLLQPFTRRSRLCSVCAKSSSPSRSPRQFSSTALQYEELAQPERPRWSYTPEKMKAPFHPRQKDPRKAWKVNEDPKRVDAMYIKLLGRGGDKVLTDEVKWLAITHKSFDQGRRGFNDRLAFFGKRLLLLQTTLTLLHHPLTTATAPQLLEPYSDTRTPFTHPALDGLPNLTAIPPHTILTKERLGQLASSYGINEVTRWKPKNPANLDGSGQNVVFTTSLFAILGALALQKGGDVANQVARDKILKPLGL